VSEPFYEWLLHTDFSEIGISRARKIAIDGEEIELRVVDLDKGNIRNRQRFREFLVEVIVQEANIMLQHLGDAPSQKEYQEATYKLRKLQQLRTCIEDENYQFLQKAS
jgi:hypothetical protein